MMVRIRDERSSISVDAAALAKRLERRDPRRPNRGDHRRDDRRERCRRGAARTTLSKVSLRPVTGSSKPLASNISFDELDEARSRRRSRAAEARTPISAASARTAPRTWRDEAPSVRSIANSRVRWTTVIENVLKIRKPPTKTEMPANTRSAVVRKREALGDVARVLLSGLRAGHDVELRADGLLDPRVRAPPASCLPPPRCRSRRSGPPCRSGAAPPPA